MKITFKNNTTKEYNAADSNILTPYLLENLSNLVIIENCIRLPDHTQEDLEKILDELYHKEEKEGCIGCDEEIYVGAGGYCASCWNNVFGCEEEVCDED